MFVCVMRERERKRERELEGMRKRIIRDRNEKENNKG